MFNNLFLQNILLSLILFFDFYVDGFPIENDHQTPNLKKRY